MRVRPSRTGTPSISEEPDHTPACHRREDRAGGCLMGGELTGGGGDGGGDGNCRASP